MSSPEERRFLIALACLPLPAAALLSEGSLPVPWPALAWAELLCFVVGNPTLLSLAGWPGESGWAGKANLLGWSGRANLLTLPVGSSDLLLFGELEPGPALVC